MNFPGSSSSSQFNLQSTLAWLTKEPLDDAALDLGLIKHHLSAVDRASLPPSQRLKLIRLFQTRTDATSAALKLRLIEARLPLQNRLRLIAQGLISVHGTLAANLFRSFRELAADPIESPELDTNDLFAAILHNLAEQQQVALLVATTAPAGLWTEVQAVYRWLRGTRNGSGNLAAEPILKHMLALAAVQPESLTARETAILVDYLPQFAKAVEIANEPRAPTNSWFWLDDIRDLPPVALSRKPPPVHGTALYFSCANLAAVASQHLLRLSKGELPAERRLPAWTTIDEYREALSRALSHWLSPPKRQAPRRASHYRVEVCARLDRLWAVLQERQPDGAAHGALTPPPITDWLVLNESTSGYAMMHVAGAIDDLVAGDILGVRSAPDSPWHICLLRWGRSDNEAHIEIGLELISSSATPVQLARQSGTAASLAPSLLLASPANGDGDETLFIQRGQLVGNRFTLIGDEAGKLRVAECEVQRLALQTARVEMLTFKRDYAAR